MAAHFTKFLKFFAHTSGLYQTPVQLVTLVLPVLWLKLQFTCCFLPMPVQQRIRHFILKEAGGLSNEWLTKYIYMRRYRQWILFM